MAKEKEVLRRRIELSKKEEQLLSFIREIENGELHIIISKGVPVKAEQIERDIEL